MLGVVVRLSRTAPVALALTALPALVVTTAAASPPSSPEPSSPTAVFTLDASKGTFSAKAAGGPRVSVLATHIGQGADTKVLQAGDERAVSDTTFARSSEPSARSAWAASSKFADLSWADVGAKTYTLYRDGAKIGTTSKPSFRDTGVTPGTEADYRIIGAGKKDTHTWGMTATIPSSDTTKALNATAKDVEAKARKYSKSTLRWRSFIRPTWAGIPKELAKLSGCKYTKGYKYAGDARGFSAKQKNPGSRAGVTGTVNWKSGKITWDRFTGKTRVYKTSNSRLVATRKASVKKIKFKALNKHNGKERGVRMIIDATDPFCPKTGAKRAGIGASATVQMTRGGSFHVTGKHRQAPDHELYMYNYAGKKYKTKTILRDKMLDLRCISQPACQLQNIAAKG